MRRLLLVFLLLSYNVYASPITADSVPTTWTTVASIPIYSTVNQPNPIFTPIDPQNTMINSAKSPIIPLSTPGMSYRQRAKAHTNLGISYLESGDQRAAIREFNRDIELNGYNQESYYLTARAYNELGDFYQVINVANAGLKTNPNDAMLYAELGRAYNGLSKYITGYSYLYKSLIIDPNYEYSRYWYAKWLYDFNIYTNAALNMEAAVKLSNDDYKTYKDMRIILAKSYEKTGNTNQAIKNIDIAIKQAPYSYETYLTKGIIMLENGKIKESLELFNKSTTLNFSNDKANYYKGIAYFYLNDYNNAAKSFNTAMKYTFSLNKQIVYYESLVAYSTGQNIQDVINNLDVVISKSPNETYLYIERAKLKMKINDKTANADFQKAYKITSQEGIF